jgi:hypothetical protein
MSFAAQLVIDTMVDTLMNVSSIDVGTLAIICCEFQCTKLRRLPDAPPFPLALPLLVQKSGLAYTGTHLPVAGGTPVTLHER